MTKIESYVAGNTTDALIAAEVFVQDKMWGSADERRDGDKSDADSGELLAA